MKFPERSDGKGKHIVKLKPEESITGIFLGEIHSFNQHWDNKKSYTCTGSGSCSYCQDGQKSSYRFQLNFITKENAVYVAKIFEHGWKVMQQLEELNKDYPLELTWVKITRRGNGTDTTYAILPIKDFLLTSSQKKELEKVQLHVLDNSGNGMETRQTIADEPTYE
jgi:hypothetical protein